MIQKLTKVSNQNINSIFENESHLEYSIPNTKFITLMYNLIRSYEYKKETFKTNITDMQDVKVEFMGNHIAEYIKTHKFYNNETSFVLNDISVALNIYSSNIINVDKYLFYIKLVLHLCMKTSSKPPKEFSVKLILTDMAKTKPTLPVERSHINSGQTDPNKNHITIFRKEEWFKVFIHECIHLFELDFCNKRVDYVRLFKPLFKIESDFLLFEAYTEFWARIINLSIISYYTVDHISLHHFEKIMLINIQVERLFCINQMNHLLHNIGITYESLFIELKLRENTNFFCYYVLTSILFYNFNDTMDWCMKHNDNLLQFSNKNVYIFFNFIKKHYRKPDFLHFIKGADKPLHNCNMSAFDIFF